MSSEPAAKNNDIRRRVLFVSQFSWPAEEEIRLKRISNELQQWGYACWVACPGSLQDRSLPGTRGMRTLRFLPMRSVWGERLAKPAPGNLLWLFWLVAVCLRMRPDIIVLRNVRPALDCVIAAKVSRSRLVADLSENYASLFRVDGSSHRGPANVVKGWMSGWLESLAARHASRVIVVCEENAERLNRFRCGRPAAVIVGNLPSASEFVTRASRRAQKGVCRLVYLGLLDRFRAIDVVLLALERLAKRNLEFEILGDGTERPRFEALARRLSIARKVHFRGRVPREEALEHIRAADIAVIPHVKCELFETSIPNKLYDYFAAGLPIIATDAAPLTRELALARAGLAVPNDPSAWADAIARLQDSGSLAEELGMNGFRFGARHRTWETNRPALRAVFEHGE